MGDFYYALFDSLIAGNELAHGREGYYFVENGEYPLVQVCDAIGKHLYEVGKVGSSTPVDLAQDERDGFPWVMSLPSKSIFLKVLT